MNVMVFPDVTYDKGALAMSGDQYTFTHQAQGADRFRWSWNFSKNWTSWQPYEAVTTIAASNFSFTDNFWDGEHIMVQCAYFFFLPSGS
jgi:alpha-1,3-glucan synthase